MKRRLLAIACLLVPCAIAAAQTSPITVLTSPTPNQTLRLRTTEVVDTMIAAEPAQPPMQAIEPRETHMTVTLELTSTVGPTDDRGRYDARVICDRAEVTATINGSPAPTPALTAEDMVGRRFTVRYGEHNDFRTLLAEGAAGPHIAAVMDSVSDALAIPMPPPLSVGETVTVASGSFLSRVDSGDPNDKLIPGGNTRYTLSAITFDGADRIAHLTMTSTGTGTFDLRRGIPGTGTPASVSVRERGQGTSEVNVDRGIVIRHEQRVTTETLRHVKGGPTAPGLGDVRTTTTVTLTVERIP